MNPSLYITICETKVISKQMFFAKYQDGIFKESPNLVPIIFSWMGRRVNTSSFPQSHFLKGFLFQWKVLFQKKPSTTAVIPHILDSNGVVCFLHFSGYLEADCKILVSPILAPLWQVLWQTIQGTEIALIVRRSAKWKYIFHCAIQVIWRLSLCWETLLQLGQRAARGCVGGLGNAWQVLGKDRGELRAEQITPGMPLKGKPKFSLHKSPNWRW